MMRVDMRVYQGTRDAVHAGVAALRVQGRQIWGDDRLTLPQIALRLTVGVGDLARLARDEVRPKYGELVAHFEQRRDEQRLKQYPEIKKELGNIIFSTIRWVDDLGFDVLECLDLAIEAQEKFANSGRPR